MELPSWTEPEAPWGPARQASLLPGPAGAPTPVHLGLRLSGVRDRGPSVPAPGNGSAAGWVISESQAHLLPVSQGSATPGRARPGQGQQRFQKAHSARPDARCPMPGTQLTGGQKTWFLVPESGKGEGISLYKKTARLAIRKNFATQGSKDGFAGFPAPVEVDGHGYGQCSRSRASAGPGRKYSEWSGLQGRICQLFA